MDQKKMNVLSPGGLPMPSLDDWLKEAQAEKNAGKCGMYLFHAGVVRETAKQAVRNSDRQPAVADAALCQLHSRPAYESAPEASQAVSEFSEKAAAAPGSDTQGSCLHASSCVTGMQFSYDAQKAAAAAGRAKKMPGIYYVRVWLNEGLLSVGDPLMLVLVGGDIRPRVIAALESLVEELKTACVTEKELH